MELNSVVSKGGSVVYWKRKKKRNKNKKLPPNTCISCKRYFIRLKRCNKFKFRVSDIMLGTMCKAFDPREIEGNEKENKKKLDYKSKSVE